MHWLDFNATDLHVTDKFHFTSAYMDPFWFITVDTGTAKTKTMCSA